MNNSNKMKVVKFNKETSFDVIKELYETKTKKVYEREKEEYLNFINKNIDKINEDLFYFKFACTMSKISMSIYHINNWLSNDLYNKYVMDIIKDSQIVAEKDVNINYGKTLEIMDCVINRQKNKNKLKVDFNYLLNNINFKIRDLFKEVPSVFYCYECLSYSNLKCFNVSLNQMIELIDKTIPIINDLYKYTEDYMVYCNLFK